MKILNAGVSMFGPRFMAKWDGLSQSPILPGEVLDAGRKGARIGWQMNDFLGVREGGGCIYAPIAIRPCANLGEFKAILEKGMAKGGKQ